MATATTATLAQNTYALDKLLADVKARVGEFLGNEKKIYDAKTRLDAIVGASGVPAQIKANGQALKAKAEALLTIQKDAENSATSLIGRAGELRTKMETNPLYSFLKTPSKDWGLRQYELIGGLLKDTLALIPEGTALTARLLKHNSAVKTFVGEVEGTERAAAGTGALPMIQGVISSTVGATAKSLTGLVWPVAIAAAAGLALWAGASSGMFRRRS